ncbi:MAG TPA: hypothetical protein VIG74_06570, partial [Alphaproteobacteria bacterium]
DDRDDATFENRMAVYHEHTDDLREFFDGKGVLHEIDAMGTEDEVFTRVEKILAREGIFPIRKINVPQNRIDPPHLNGPG